MRCSTSSRTSIARDDFDQAKSRIKQLLTRMVANLKERKIPMDDLAFNVMMGKSIEGYKSTRAAPEPARKKEPRTQQLQDEQSSLFHGAGDEEIAQDLGGGVGGGGLGSSAMGGLPQHVKAAILLRNSNREVKAGEIISFVKTKGGHGVKPTAQARAEDVDVDKYVEYASSMFDQVLSALDLSFEQVVPRTSLDAFWG